MLKELSQKKMEKSQLRLNNHLKLNRKIHKIKKETKNQDRLKENRQEERVLKGKNHKIVNYIFKSQI